MKFFNDLTGTFTTVNRLPHWQQDGATYFFTYRLADSIPRELMDDWQARRVAWIALHPKPWDGETGAEYHKVFSAEIDRMLDKGHGSCVLAREDFRAILTESFDHFESTRYLTHSRVIMPNHVHVLLTLADGAGLDTVVGSWKKRTGRIINLELKKTGAFWQKDYFDRIIRDWTHFGNVARYIRNNPTKAKLGEARHTLWEGDLVKRFEGGLRR